MIPMGAGTGSRRIFMIPKGAAFPFFPSLYPRVPPCPGTGRIIPIPEGSALPSLLRVPARTSDSSSVLELSPLQAGRLPGRIPGSRASPCGDSAGVTVKVIPRAVSPAGQTPLIPPSPFPMENQLSRDLPTLGIQREAESGLSLQTKSRVGFSHQDPAWMPLPSRSEQHIPKGRRIAIPWNFPRLWRLPGTAPSCPESCSHIGSIPIPPGAASRWESSGLGCPGTPGCIIPG